MAVCVTLSCGAMRRKLLQAITGDRVSIAHPSLRLPEPASTFVSVRWADRPYHVISTPPSAVFDSTMTTGEYRLNEHLVRVRERVDQLDMGAAGVVYESTLFADHGQLQVISHGWHAEGLELFEQLNPIDSPLGVAVSLGPGLRVLAAPQILLDVAGLGVLSIKPLTPDLASLLPQWKGTEVVGGELFAANLTRTEPYLLLVTPTAQVSILLRELRDLDAVTALAADLAVDWSTPR